MFGIGLPEMLLIMALALIVIGPDKLPDLARSLAKGLLDLKKTAEELKHSIAEETNPLTELKPELEDAARSLTNNLLDAKSQDFSGLQAAIKENNPATMAVEAYQELLRQTGGITQKDDEANHPETQNQSTTPKQEEKEASAESSEISDNQETKDKTRS